MLFHSCHLKHPFLLLQEGIRSYFGTPTWQTIGVFLAGVLTTVVVIRKMWTRGLIRRWRLREERVKTVKRGWNRPPKENGKTRGRGQKGIWIEIYRERQIRELKMTSTHRKRERRGGKKESMMQMSRATLVTPEPVPFLIYNL